MQRTFHAEPIGFPRSCADAAQGRDLRCAGLEQRYGAARRRRRHESPRRNRAKPLHSLRAGAAERAQPFAAGAAPSLLGGGAGLSSPLLAGGSSCGAPLLEELDDELDELVEPPDELPGGVGATMPIGGLSGFFSA